MIKICIADNHPVVLHGIRSYFKNHPKIYVASILSTFTTVCDSLSNINFDVLVIDIELEGLNSISTLKCFMEKHPHTKILIYTCASEKLFGVMSHKAGFAGFISKCESLKNLENAVLSIASGKTAYSNYVHENIFNSFGELNHHPLYRKLSSRESEVLQCFINGKKNIEISEMLDLNAKTISTYKLRLLRKLNVTNLVDLINKAKNLEIV